MAHYEQIKKFSIKNADFFTSMIYMRTDLVVKVEEFVASWRITEMFYCTTSLTRITAIPYFPYGMKKVLAKAKWLYVLVSCSSCFCMYAFVSHVCVCVHVCACVCVCVCTCTYSRVCVDYYLKQIMLMYWYCLAM